MTPSHDKDVLEQAFAAFNAHSSQLESSYRVLHQRVAELSDELAAANSERLRQLQDKERLAGRLERLLGALPGGVLVIDGEGRISDCNQAAVDMLGEPLMNRHWRAVLDRAGAMDDQGELVLSGGRRIGVARRALRAEPGHIVLLTDVTEARRLQAMLARNQRLAEMGEVAARLAHQVRTPLSSAMLYASQIGRPSLDLARRQRYAGRIGKRLAQLERLVADMLGYARGGRSGEDRIDIEALLHDVAHMIEPHCRRGDCVAVAIEGEPAAIEGNRDALAGALANLCTNALQAAPAGVTVTLTARAAGARHVELGVLDDGPGMAPSVAAQVFEPFFTTRTDGTGLGLAVVKSTAEAHGGDVRLESGAERGCHFILRIPSTEGDTPLPAQAEAAPSPEAVCA